MKAKILIVDDEPLNVKLLTAKIPRDKFDMVVAYSGEEALAKVDEVVPDLILLDVMMPGLNGYEITQKLKGDPKTQHIPIILITALDGADDQGQGAGGRRRGVFEQTGEQTRTVGPDQLHAAAEAVPGAAVPADPIRNPLFRGHPPPNPAGPAPGRSVFYWWRIMKKTFA